MCGIVGYVGARPALSIVLDGLRRLEYRGYDSAGVALISDGDLVTCKRAGKLANLERALVESPDGAAIEQGLTGIGHTRWATHGGPTDRNAHPHRSSSGRLAVIHNGIIENFAKLRAELEADGVEFASDTDTESAAHLLERELAAVREEGRHNGDHGRALAEAMRRVCLRLDGAFTLLALDADTPDVVVGARRNSPLVVGRGVGENFLASDVSAFIEHTREAVELGQDQVVLITPELVEITDFDGVLAAGKDFHVDWDASAAEKGGFEWFMQKEIAEQPRAIADALRGRLTDTGQIKLDEVRLTEPELREIDKIFIVACGTAYHSGLVAKYAIEHWTRIPCEVELASEFRYRDPVLDRSTLVVAISQSGETMDTLMALRHAKDQKARVLAICNTNGSTIPRESDAVLYTYAGPEIAVASTKAFLTQIVACYLVGLYLAQVRGNMYGDEVRAILAQLADMPSAVEAMLETIEPVRALARELAQSRTVLFIGRHVGYPVALEGALKLKELAYIHAEGFAAGELKHGPIALIEEGTPVICVLPSPDRGGLHQKVISNMQEVRARGARTIAIAERGDEAVRPFADHVIEVPATPSLLAPLVTTVPLQVFACEIAMARGHDVDQPRNLAKSVTVEVAVGTSLAAFAVFAAVLTITPGIDTILVLRTTAVSGRRAGFVAVLGILLGCLVWAVTSALGVTAVLAASEVAFTVLRVAGAAYLCWLGLRALWRSRRPAIEKAAIENAAIEPAPQVSMSTGAAFRAGLLSNVLNPKIGVFYLSVMPQFLPSGVNPLTGSLALAGVHVLEGLVWLSLIVVAVNRARHWLGRPAVKRRLEQLTGLAFITFGLRIALDPPR